MSNLIRKKYNRALKRFFHLFDPLSHCLMTPCGSHFRSILYSSMKKILRCVNPPKLSRKLFIFGIITDKAECHQHRNESEFQIVVKDVFL